MNLTPNVKRLLIEKISLLAVPPGGGFGAGVELFTVPGRLASVNKEALAWVGEAIKVVRLAKEPNPWKNATDEEIATEIMRGVDERKSKRKK